MALRPDRSSSYNTVFATPDGRVVNVEGSATDAELDGLDDRGRFAHTNHYACDADARVRGRPGVCREVGRAAGVGRANCSPGAPDGAMDAAWMRAALADHATTPSICRHAEADREVATAFWCIADVTAGEIRYGLGNPCEPGEERFSFA